MLCTDTVGQQRWFAVDRISIVGNDGVIEQHFERWRDITHQEELQRRLLLHEQLASLGRLAASIAHEVGNPL
jgi:nitrogen-specific signal transduction histidine kinase